MACLLLILIAIINQVATSDLYTPWIISGGPTFASYKFNVLEHLTGIAPYFESISDGLNPDPPKGCKVSKAVYLLRHGAIYVNDNDYLYVIEPFLERLKNSSNLIDFHNSADLAFLANWTSPISNSDEQIEKLAKLGFLESFNFGSRLAHRYPHLLPVENSESFKVWAAGSGRTFRSAEAFFAGIHAGHDMIGRLVSVPEERNQGANTLTPRRSCPNFHGSNGVRLAEPWLRHYTAPIIARLNSEGTGFQFSSQDVLAMQELCGYETIVRSVSPFCKLFASDEWLAFEYYFDIKYHYELGYGNTLSPTLGMPWVVAASDVLSQTEADTQNLYISISHRQMPPFVVTALGLFNNSEYTDTENINDTFPLNEINERRAWKTSSFLTFMGHIGLERLDCQSAAYTGSFVRVLVNSAPKPLPGCSDGPGSSCPLQQYKEYIKTRSESFEGFSEACGLKNRTIDETLNIFVKDAA